MIAEDVQGACLLGRGQGRTRLISRYCFTASLHGYHFRVPTIYLVDLHILMGHRDSCLQILAHPFFSSVQRVGGDIWVGRRDPGLTCPPTRRPALCEWIRALLFPPRATRRPACSIRSIPTKHLPLPNQPTSPNHPLKESRRHRCMEGSGSTKHSQGRGG